MAFGAFGAVQVPFRRRRCDGYKAVTRGSAVLRSFSRRGHVLAGNISKWSRLYRPSLPFLGIRGPGDCVQYLPKTQQCYSWSESLMRPSRHSQQNSCKRSLLLLLVENVQLSSPGSMLYIKTWQAVPHTVLRLLMSSCHFRFANPGHVADNAGFRTERVGWHDRDRVREGLRRHNQAHL